MRKIRPRRGEPSNDSQHLNIPNASVKKSSKKLQIVGFKNSGKTTLTENLIIVALEHGFRTSAIKHHGHGGAPDLPPPTTDASRFFRAGAASSIVVGGEVVLLQVGQQQESDRIDDLDTLIRYTENCADPDLILIEGFKNERYPKILLLRSLEDWTSLRSLPNIELIVTANEDLQAEIAAARKHADEKSKLPIFSRRQSEDIAAWFTDWLKGDHHESL